MGVDSFRERRRDGELHRPGATVNGPAGVPSRFDAPAASVLGAKGPS